MPGLLVNGETGRKRKRVEGKPERRRVAKKRDTGNGEDAQDQILLLEAETLQSRQKWTNIDRLLKLCRTEEHDHGTQIIAAVALCRIFCRLTAAEKMVRRRNMNEQEVEDVAWLRSRSRDYMEALSAMLQDQDPSVQSTALTLIMRLAKEEVSQEGQRGEQAWTTPSHTSKERYRSAFSYLIRALCSSSTAAVAREEFVEKYLEEHDDVRFFTFQAVANMLKRSAGEVEVDSELVGGCLALLSHVEGIPTAEETLEDWYGPAPEGPKNHLLSLSAHRKQAQDAWLEVFSLLKTKDQRKAVLDILSERIAPWFTKPETLMDFLTDSYNEGGATSLLALSGLYFLMSERNLDYPQFYPKLYSLLDDGLLHSKHRSRFFRLLDTFMSSTHLPAAMVASFIKRLSRLALHAPPGGIVVILPWVYNMLKMHPTCTFMIHRITRDTEARTQLEEAGMDDPFDMVQPDPMETAAIDSCLWELETLQSHYHPNVATLAKIISEQFTKREYSLEDFLDHSYQGIIDAELGKELRKPPVVESEIPKRVFTTDEGGLDKLGTLLDQAIQVL